MKILKNVLAGIGILVIFITTFLIIFFCGFAAGMDFKDKAEEWIDRILYRNKKTHIDEFDNIIFSSMKDAETVLNDMNDILGSYGVVTIADMYDLAGISSSDRFNDSKYGWFSLDCDCARIISTCDGYIIDLPEPSYLMDDYSVNCKRPNSKAKYVNYERRRA